MRHLTDLAHAGRRADALVILLPGAYHQPEDFIAQGFISAVRERGLDIDLQMAELKFEDIANLNAVQQIHDCLVQPALGAGYRHIWLAGISIGGYIAMAYADRYAVGQASSHLAGLLLLAPYPGSRIVTNEIMKAGGLQAWSLQDGDVTDAERRNWHWLKTHAGIDTPTYLAYGTEDRFADGHALMGTSLAESHVYCIPGDHTWPAWQKMWHNFLDTHSGSFAMDTSKPRRPSDSGNIDDTPLEPAALAAADTPHTLPPTTQKWQPALLLKLSLLLHVLAIIAVMVMPAAWPWILAVVLVDHAVVVIAGLLPRSTWLGSNWTKLPASAAARNEVALTIDDGPNPAVTPQVLDVLERYQARATFFCIGEKAQRYPELCREIVRRGHAVENHSQHHYLDFSLYGVKRITREVEAAQDTLEAITSQRPQFFRAPAGLRNMFLDIVLVRSRLRLASWSVRAFDTKVGNPVKVRDKLLSKLRPGAILLLHDDNSAQTSADTPVILEVLPGLIEHALRAKLRFVTLREAAL